MELSVEEQEVVDSISNELIISGLPMDAAGDVLAFAGGFGFRPRGGRGGRGWRGGRHGGRGHHHDHGDHAGHHGTWPLDDSDGDSGLDEAFPGDPLVDDPVLDDLVVQPLLDPAPAPEPSDDALLDPADGSAPVEAVISDAPEIVEPVVVDQPELDDPTEEALAELLEDYEGEEFELDPEDLGEVLDEIDDPAVDQMVNGGNTLTLAQVQQLFELYFNTINNTTITENTTNNTFVDNSVNQSMVINDNSVNTINIDNSVSNIVDNSDNSINDFSKVNIQDSFNSIVDNSVNHFQLSRYNVSLDGMISGERERGREAVRGTRHDDVIEAGPGKDRLIGRRGADSFVFNDADGCGRRHADQIRDFRPRQGDRILLDSDAFGGEGRVAVAENRREFRQLKREGDVDFLYYQPRGNLFYDANGSKSGFGDGGLLAALKGSPNLTAEQINLI